MVVLGGLGFSCGRGTPAGLPRGGPWAGAGQSKGVVVSYGQNCRGASLERKRHPVGPYSRTISRVLGGSQEGERFLMGEVPL